MGGFGKRIFSISFVLYIILGTEVFGFYAPILPDLRSCTEDTDQSRVIAVVKKAENYIKKYGKEKAIITFRKTAHDIVMGDYDGRFFVSPLHPELIGHNQFNYKDPSGVFVVQEEIKKAKAGGGWLKGRWRKNPQTGKYECRKIYILPMPGNYFIGSWYHYPSNKQGICLM